MQSLFERTLMTSVALALVATISLPAGSQVLGGAAVDGRSGAALGTLHVRLLGCRADAVCTRAVDSTRTDPLGLFRLTAPGAGVYQLEFIPAVGAITRGPVDTIAADALLLRRFMVNLEEVDSTPARVLAEFEVEKRAELLRGQPSPKYPAALTAEQLKGEVLAQFVVDTSGRARPDSFRALHSTHPAFTAAVQEAVYGMRFKPAEVRGVRVPQMVQMPFAFEPDRWSRPVNDRSETERETLPGERERPREQGGRPGRPDRGR